MDYAERQIVSLSSGKTGQIRALCPFCSHTRKNKSERCLSIGVEIDKVRYQCWHCEAVGVIDFDDVDKIPKIPKPTTNRSDSSPKPLTEIKQATGDLTAAGVAFLASRNVSRETAKAAGCFSTRKYFRKLGREGECIAFPYMHDGAVTGLKYRSIETKDYSWDGRAAGLWGAENIVEGMFGEKCPIIICEGELDRLALLEAGVVNACSVPNGAPKQVAEGRASPEEDRLFAYVWAAREKLDAAEKIIIALDGDEPGEAGAEEIARRIGKGKCWSVKYPDGCKDANDVLINHGPDAIQDLIDEAQPWPVAGVFAASHYADKVDGLYQSGPGKGLSTGLACLDELFTISPGQVSVVTGIPGSGKSEFIDQLMFNLATTHSHKFAVCSFENPPAYHIVKLSQKYNSKPFFSGPHMRQSPAEVERAKKWINNHFCFLDFSDGVAATIDAILDRAKSAVQRLGVRGLVIDPYNYIQIDKRADSETNLISDMLTRVRSFAIAHDVHVWLIAHPQKMQRSQSGALPIPKGFDISGSAAWFAKCDLGITCARPEMHINGEDADPNAAPSAEIHVWKCRFSWMGSVGEASLLYNPLTGQYTSTGTNANWLEVDEALEELDNLDAGPLERAVARYGGTL